MRRIFLMVAFIGVLFASRAEAAVDCSARGLKSPIWLGSVNYVFGFGILPPCQFDPSATVFYSGGYELRAIQVVNGVVIFARSYIDRGTERREIVEISVADDPLSHFAEGQFLPKGRYHFIRLLNATKATGFPMKIPFFERLSASN